MDTSSALIRACCIRSMDHLVQHPVSHPDACGGTLNQNPSRNWYSEAILLLTSDFDFMASHLVHSQCCWTNEAAWEEIGSLGPKEAPMRILVPPNGARGESLKVASGMGGKAKSPYSLG